MTYIWRFSVEQVPSLVFICGEQVTPANTLRRHNAGLILGQRHRRWPGINPAVHQCLHLACVPVHLVTSLDLFYCPHLSLSSISPPLVFLIQPTHSVCRSPSTSPKGGSFSSHKDKWLPVTRPLPVSGNNPNRLEWSAIICYRFCFIDIWQTVNIIRSHCHVVSVTGFGSTIF